MSGSDGVDAVTRTFLRDREFCDALAASHARHVGRLLVYAKWVHNYMTPIQEELHHMAARHFPAQYVKDAGFWTLTNTGGIGRDLLLVPYLVLRGVISEAGFALRRSFENAGVLAHLWSEPSVSAFLGSQDDQGFRRAFIWEPKEDRRRALKAAGIQKRFERCAMPQPLTQLYSILSELTVHGGSPSQLMNTELVPTRFSCAMLNRPDPAAKDISRELTLLGNGCEMLCIEVATIHGTYGKKYSVTPSKGGEGGFYLTKLLDQQPDGEMSKAITAALAELGWLDLQARSDALN